MSSRHYSAIALWTALLLPMATVAAADWPFAVAPATREAVVVERVFDGVVEPLHQSTVSAQLVGRIVEINFDVDDFVPKDSVLIRFQDAEPRARLEQEQANLKDAQARLTRARDEHERILSLYEKKLVSTADRDRVVAEFNSAQAGYDRVTARIEEARQQLNYTVVKAPYAGVVVARHVQLGETVQVGQPLMTGFSLDTLRVVSVVPQDLVQRIRETGRARVLYGHGAGAVSVPADELTVFPYADQATHGFRVWVNLPPKQQGLYPGMFVKVAFATPEAARLLAPQAALVQRGEVTAAYVARADGALSFRFIRVGHVFGDKVEVLSGLDDGEMVALDPVAAAVYLKEHQQAGR